jgi:transposase InsO family protein
MALILSKMEPLHDGKKVIPSEDIPLLQKLFDDPLYMQTSGPRFWARISTEYTGISRNDCQVFLESKRVSQIFKKPPKFREVTPICTRYPRSQFNVDFVDLNGSEWANGNRRYLYNVIDHFSKFAWSFALPSRDPDAVTEIMRGLFASGHVPRVFHADNEFKAKTLIQLCDEWNVVLVSSASYYPQANGSIERFSGTLKKAIKQIQQAYDDKTFVDALQKLVLNYNRTPHSSHGMTPETVYFTRDQSVIDTAFERAQHYRKTRILKKSTEDLDIEPGTVRVANSTVSSKRKAVMGLRKPITPPFSKDVYKVEKHLLSRSPMTNDKYVLEGKSQLFTRSQILPIPEETDNSVPDQRPSFDAKFRGRTPKTRVAKTDKKKVRTDRIGETPKKTKEKTKRPPS